MSYDLMVFEAKKAPKNQKDFLNWYLLQTKWEEDHGYNDPKVSSSNLQNWFLEMIQTFPAMNGPLSPSDEEIDNDENLEKHLTDYSVGKDIIYAAFNWSLSEEANRKMKELAVKHGVGFYDVSGSGQIIWPE